MVISEAAAFQESSCQKGKYKLKLNNFALGLIGQVQKKSKSLALKFLIQNSHKYTI